MAAPDDEFLRRTVLPLLYPALEIVNTERPNDPISYIAYYLLKNQHKIKLPEPPEPVEKVDEEGEHEGEEGVVGEEVEEAE